MHVPGFNAKHQRGPIFVVGSPRSGTSILTWCLGQHANILPQEESGWMGEFAINIGVQYQTGVKRGERSLLGALNVDREEFFKTFGDGINDMILRHRAKLEHHSQCSAEQNPTQIHPAFNISRSSDDPKSRWVDGTPEYSLYICALKKLFPDAKFVHIVRDVQSVVNSLLNFKADGCAGFVETEQGAYEYWLRTVQACVQAERALGAQTIYRLRYDDLINRPDWVMRHVLEFLDEPFMAACVEPIANRINSSEVPIDFHAADQRTNKDVIERALLLSEELQRPFSGYSPSPDAMLELDAEFNERVRYMSVADVEYTSALENLVKLVTRLNWCGVMLAANLCLALAVNLIEGTFKLPLTKTGSLLWLLAAMIGVGSYIAFRWIGFRDLGMRIIQRYMPNRTEMDSALGERQ
jgi:hypothetical protein